MFGNHGLGGLLEEGAHGKSPKCLGGNLGDFGEFCKGLSLPADQRDVTCKTSLDALKGVLAAEAPEEKAEEAKEAAEEAKEEAKDAAEDAKEAAEDAKEEAK